MLQMQPMVRVERKKTKMLLGSTVQYNEDLTLYKLRQVFIFFISSTRSATVKLFPAFYHCPLLELTFDTLLKENSPLSLL